MMKKLIALSLTILFSLNFSISQVPNFMWASSQGGTSYDSGKSIVVDNSGNSYTAGIFAGTVDMDPSSSTMNITSEGSYDAFVSKLDVNGQLVWAFSIGSTSADEINSITIDGNGDIIVVGKFQDIVDFDPSGNVFQQGAIGSADIFVAKYTASGNFVWVKQMGGNSEDVAFDVETDNLGNVYSTGHFYGTADFDPATGVTAHLTSYGMMDVFVSKLDVNGDFVWVKQIGGASEESGTSISIDANGDVLVGGNFSGTVDFDPDATTNNVTSNGGVDAFGLKLDSNGAYINVVKLGDTGNEYCLSIDSDATNNIYLGGSFYGTMDIDPLGTTTNITSNGNSDVFVLKYDQNFQLSWGHGFGGPDGDSGRGIKVDINGNVYATGYIRGTVDFDPGANVANLTSNGGLDIFLLKLSGSGTYDWASNFGSSWSDSGYEIGLWNDNVYTVGDYSGTVDFDPSPGNNDLVSAGSQDIFTLALGCLTTTGTDVQTACDSYTWIDGNTYTSDNNTATHTLTNAAGCDSVVTLDLTILNSTTGTDVQTACDSYTWIDGNTYTSSNNSATHTLTNAAGCDSVVTLDLTINYSNTGTDVQTSCDSYTWIDGNTYTSDNNTATYTLTNMAGCDSVVTLDLTILNSTTGTDVQTACDSYTWIDGNTYTSSNNTATQTLTNAAGCDSVVTLDLTINYSTTGTDVQTACDSYTWIDGNTYTSSNNTATHTLTNVAGCDSVVTLDLTIESVSNLTVNQNDNILAADLSGASYQWIDCDNNDQVISGATDQIFTASTNGSYAVIITEGNCTDTTDCVTVSTIGVESLDMSDAGFAYPNPTKGKVHVNTGLEQSITSVSVKNVFGRTVSKEFSQLNEEVIVNVVGSPGVYFIEVTSKSGEKSIYKVIKK